MTPVVERHLVTLHGLGRTSYSMRHLGSRLARSGFTVHHFGYRSRSRTIDEQCERLREFIAGRIPAGSALYFVTHSLGSIVTRRYCERFGAERCVSRIVMLGPPNQGSSMARLVGRFSPLRWLLGPALLQLQDLAEGCAPAGVEVGIIAGGRGGAAGISPFLSGDNDGIVTVAETALPGAKVLLLPGGLHSFLMYYPRAIEEIRCFLETGSFSEPPPADRSSDG